MASANEYLKRKDIAESHFLMSFLFIQCHKDSCYEHITVGVNICLNECFSLLASEYAVCLCVRSNQRTSKKLQTTLLERPQ